MIINIKMDGNTVLKKIVHNVGGFKLKDQMNLRFTCKVQFGFRFKLWPQPYARKGFSALC